MLPHMTHSSAPRLPEIVGQIYELLLPLDAQTQVRVLKSALGLLGEASEEALQILSLSKRRTGSGAETDDASGLPFGPKAKAWARRHGLTDGMLENAFHFDSNFELIAKPPGKNNREKTINAYILIGVQHFLQSDDTKFNEAAAVAICKRFGCHDATNHAQTRGKFGNKIQGSKDSGYTLTVPGLDHAAAIIKAIGP